MMVWDRIARMVGGQRRAVPPPPPAVQPEALAGWLRHVKQTLDGQLAAAPDRPAEARLPLWNAVAPPLGRKAAGDDEAGRP